MNHWIGCAPCLSNRRVVAVVAATSMLAALVAYLTEAIADDSSATLGAGGLELTKAADIRMAAEDLYLSPNAVKLRYEFTNDGPKDVDTVVAFPLPDIDTSELYLESIGTVSNDPINFVDFRVMADGQSIPVQVEQRAFLGNRDVTDIVKSVGLPINVILANDTPLDKLAPAKKRILERAGLAEAEGSDQERPKWVVRTKFYWTQHFPAGKTIIIEHSYKPVTGQTFFTPSDLDPKAKSDRNWQQNYCMDGPTLAAIRQRMAQHKAAGQNDGTLNIYSTDFILTTANNWKGGIGRFHLTIDKLKPNNIISLCWNGGLKKTGPTRFESTLTNVAPSQDIKLVVLE